MDTIHSVCWYVIKGLAVWQTSLCDAQKIAKNVMGIFFFLMFGNMKLNISNYLTIDFIQLIINTQVVCIRCQHYRVWLYLSHVYLVFKCQKKLSSFTNKKIYH